MITTIIKQKGLDRDHPTTHCFIMPRKKKNAADFRFELENLLTTLGDDGELRVRDALRQYKTIIQIQKRGKKPLTTEQTQLLNSNVLRDNYLLGKQLEKIEKKLHAAEKCEAPVAAAAAAVATTTVSSRSTSNRAADSTTSTIATSIATTTDITAADVLIALAAIDESIYPTNGHSDDNRIAAVTDFDANAPLRSAHAAVDASISESVPASTSISSLNEAFLSSMAFANSCDTDCCCAGTISCCAPTVNNIIGDSILLSHQDQDEVMQEEDVGCDNSHSDKSIVMTKCGDLEDDYCILCKEALSRDEDGHVLRDQDKAIKVDNPRFHDEDGLSSWSHLHCWDA